LLGGSQAQARAMKGNAITDKKKYFKFFIAILNFEICTLNLFYIHFFTLKIIIVMSEIKSMMPI
jgi:hypothetical protein